MQNLLVQFIFPYASMVATVERVFDGLPLGMEVDGLPTT